MADTFRTRRVERKKEVNADMHGPLGALTVLKAIDFDDIQEKGFTTEVIVYLGKERAGVARYSAQYQGDISASRESYRGEVISASLNQIVLPTPVYTRTQMVSCPDLHGNKVPADMLFDRPDNLEFAITAHDADTYWGLQAFIQMVLPNLVSEGYTRHNDDHISEFWLYLSKSQEKTDVICISGRGLEVTDHPVEGVRIFNKFDMERFTGLKMVRK